ncbi:MAG: SDR family NAD(P)-dependent oxidoreductase, partial [Candidatus Kapabacteria bacterium]|nr:SDR family NAD(P)-dependent oxidoreductase [Candidatus Kapabacteria bacterium]
MTTDQYVLILGASSGFGRAAARALAADGFNIIGVHLDRAAGLEAVEELKTELAGHGVRTLFYNVNA